MKFIGTLQKGGFGGIRYVVKCYRLKGSGLVDATHVLAPRCHGRLPSKLAFVYAGSDITDPLNCHELQTLSVDPKP